MMRLFYLGIVVLAVFTCFWFYGIGAGSLGCVIFLATSVLYDPRFQKTFNTH